MASNQNISPYYLLQSAFSTGEISREVASRVDLEKYQFALTQAENCLIRPYGPVYKRPGTKYIAETKSGNKARLVSFNGTDGIDFLLEFTAGYIRIYKQGVYKAEVSSPYNAAALPELRFTQSADTMFIAHGNYALRTLKRTNDTTWTLSVYNIVNPYFDSSLGGGSENCTMTPSARSGNITITSNENVFSAGLVGAGLKLVQDVDSKIVSVSTEAVTPPSTSITGTYTSSVLYALDAVKVTITGTWAGSVKLQQSTNGTDFHDVATYSGNTSNAWTYQRGYYRLYANITSGTQITATVYSERDDGDEGGTYYVEVDSRSIAKSGYAWIYSTSVYVGEQWKIETSGTWKGTIIVERSLDNSTWTDYRKYTSDNNGNYTEAGSVTAKCWLRIKANRESGSSGALKANLTALAYTHTGWAKITGFTDAKHVTASVQDQLGTTGATKSWSLSAWCEAYGYPRTVAFFQDRLCLGGSKQQPYMLWMSRTGDYNNFEVEKASGKVTDDSAVALPLVSRKQFEIRHLVPNTDLIVLTKGNEWILSGRDVITPSNASPRMQTTRGCSNVEPIMIGSKTVFVQDRGSVVRDIGYSFETDSYGGADLTLLNKSIIEGKSIVDGAYMQEPDSSLYYVMSDGTISVLSYVVDQKVYAWSRLITAGRFESVCVVAEGDADTVYTTAVRAGSTSRRIEQFGGNGLSDDADDYICVDCSGVSTSAAGSKTFTFAHLAGKTVKVLGDGREFDNIAVAANGVLTLPTTVHSCIAGLPYTMRLELPNVEIKHGDGTMQGRYKLVPEVILRLHNTLGGKVGPDASRIDEIHYDEYQSTTKPKLYSGDKKMQIPVGGFDTDGRITIYSDNVYPFYLLAVVREVSLGG